MTLKTTHHGPGLFGEAKYYEVPEEIHVYSWCPSFDGSGAPTQVHLHFDMAPGPVFVVRLKTPAGIDALIDALIEHRRDVFGAGGSR
jgi:hypothetical protein